MKKIILGVTLVVTIAAAATWNFHRTQNEVAISDLTLDNLDAMATGRGNFPACQKNEGGGDFGFIPFCVNKKCQDHTWERRGTLDVNYCTE
ncbi:NVEALA domain-containing protein [Parabacteroides pacaensis]|uniref:NVEALA domain-containing protein n=1 Tax=Parabacteroides pacaensis TaxID=2086575 RepID=UPI000D10A913|nr:NVEALA domain-containing protein [Parabacteroides pacaensis]